MPHIEPALRGIGEPRINELTQVSRRTIRRVRKGERRMMRFSTASRLYDAPVISRADGALISAARTKSMLTRIQTEGYSRFFIIQMSGLSARTLEQIHIQKQVKVSTFKAIRALYDRLVGHESDR